jgi:hypothetical protein
VYLLRREPTESQLEERIQNMRKILMGSMLLLTMGILSAQQFVIQFTSKAPFSVAGTTLPAGTYVIRPLEGDDGTFECSSVSGTPSVLFEAEPHEVTPTATDVTFVKYGDKLILKNMSIAGDQGYWIPASIQEKQSKKGGAEATKVSTAATKQ